MCILLATSHNEFEVCVMVLAVMRVLCAAVRVRGPTWPRVVCEAPISAAAGQRML